MNDEDFVITQIQSDLEVADESWKLYKGLKVSSAFDIDYTARTIDWMRYFYSLGYESAKSKTQTGVK